MGQDGKACVYLGVVLCRVSWKFFSSFPWKLNRVSISSNQEIEMALIDGIMSVK